jgi:hypothetical protein
MVIIVVASKSKQNLLTESIGFPVVGTVSPTMVRLGSRLRVPAIPGHCEPYKKPFPFLYFSLYSLLPFFCLPLSPLLFPFFHRCTKHLSNMPRKSKASTSSVPGRAAVENVAG